jgi:hypothetical protein
MTIRKLKMEICIDFDGTCVTHAYPKIGKDIGAIPVLKSLKEMGHNLILFTMRCDFEEFENCNYLTDAINWFKESGIELYGINENPTQSEWTKSPKAHGHLYIDDAALGCPTKVNKELSDRPFVDWKAVEFELKNIGYLPH